MGSLKERVQKNWRKVIILTISIFVIIFAQDIIREIVLFRNDVNDLSNRLDAQMQDNLEQEVSYRIDELDNIYLNIDETFEEDLEIEIENVRMTVDTVMEYLELSTDQEVINQISSVIEDRIVNDGIYSFTIITTDGVVLYDENEQIPSGTDLSENVDSFNRPYIEELVTTILDDDDLHGGNFSYMIDESDVTDQILYHGFKVPYKDMIVYISGSLTDYLDYKVQEYSDDLKEYYHTHEYSVFLYNKEGHIYNSNHHDLVGHNVSELPDNVSKSAVEEVILYADSNDKGYLEINDYKVGNTDEVFTHHVYIDVYEELDLIVGYSNATDINEQLVSAFVRENVTSVLRTLIPLYVVIIFVGVYVTRTVLTNNKLSIDVLNEEEQLYKVFSDLTEDIILITNKKGDIIFTNKLGRKTLYDSNEHKPLNLDDILVDEESYQVLIGIKDNYFIKSTVSQIVYDSQECDLYILNDVTEKVKTERKLEAMTLADDLTGLGNRRLLVRDYKDFVLPYIKDGKQGFLAMIDLDNFKEANDKYGHTFGDDVLIMISDIFKEHQSDNVKIYRVGGDEFALLALDISKNDCLKLLRKIKNKVSTHNYGKKLNIGFSAGVAEINIKDQKRRLSDYYEKADELLYNAKDEGKDRIKL